MIGSNEARRWRVDTSARDNPDAVRVLEDELGLCRLTAALLYSRGYRTPEAATAFLRRDDECFHDPFLLPDMDKAVERVTAAINAGERVMIYGDYDVDGVTSVATLFLYLRSKGVPVDYYIPERTSEGYGMNEGAVRRIAAGGTSLIITVDTGITAVEEIALAASLGVDTVITDHHECHGELPPAVAAVNPHRPDSVYPFAELAGVGVAFKLICAIEQLLAPDDDRYLHRMCAEYADLVTVGTVADVMPLTDENRLIVSIGLGLLERGSRIGFDALIRAAALDGKGGKSGGSNGNGENGGSGSGRNQNSGRGEERHLTASSIGFGIAPRMNAAGRIRSASIAEELLLTEDRGVANEIAARLCDINRERQELENAMSEEAFRIIEQTHDFARDRVIVLAGESWHHGVIGIVASRVTDRYGLPSILISFDGGRVTSGMSDGDIGKGSGRSIHGLDLSAALAFCSDLLVRFGGHEMAAGLTLRRGDLDEFRRRINEYAAEHLRKEDLVAVIDSDGETEAADLTVQAVKQLALLEPYGTANPTPVFAMRGATVADIRAIGGGKHTSMTLESDGIALGAVMFRNTPEELGLVRGDRADLLFSPSINEFRGNTRVQLMLRDIRHCAEERARRRTLTAEYGRVAENPDMLIPRELLPSRDDFKRVYLYIKRRLGEQPSAPMNIYRLAARSLGDGPREYIKLRFILAILVQTGIISYSAVPDYSVDGGGLYIELGETDGKVNLCASQIYKSLEARVAK